MGLGGGHSPQPGPGPASLLVPSAGVPLPVQWDLALGSGLSHSQTVRPLGHSHCPVRPRWAGSLGPPRAAQPSPTDGPGRPFSSARETLGTLSCRPLTWLPFSPRSSLPVSPCQALWLNTFRLALRPLRAQHCPQLSHTRGWVWVSSSSSLVHPKDLLITAQGG